MNRYHPLVKILLCLLITALVVFSFYGFLEKNDLERGYIGSYPSVLREKDKDFVLKSLQPIIDGENRIDQQKKINQNLKEQLERRAPLLVYEFYVPGGGPGITLSNAEYINLEDIRIGDLVVHENKETDERYNIKFFIAAPKEGQEKALTDSYYYDLYLQHKVRQANLQKITLFAGISFIMAMALSLLLLTTLGRRKDGAYPVSKIDQIPLELILGLYGAFVFFGLFFGINVFFRGNQNSRFFDLAFLSAFMLFSFPALEILMRRFHQGRLLNSLFTYKLLRKAFGFTKESLKTLPLVWKGLAIAGIYVLLSGFFLADGVNYSPLSMFIYYVLQVLFILFVAKLILGRRELRRVTADLARGDLSSKVDLEHLAPGLKEEGELLNQISEGIGRAVDERMKSENFRTELITNVSHDLKTPLTSIVSYTDLLKKEGLDSEGAPEYLDALERQSARLKKLMDDLLQVSKATTGTLDVHLEKTNVKELLQQVTGEYQEKLEKEQLELILDLPQEDLFIEADSSLIWRVLDNLLGNARKYSLPGTRVYVSAESKRKTVRIHIKNISKEKLGITAEELKQRFVRADSSRSSEGSGLGLAIAESLTQLQGGHLFLEIDGDLFKANLVFAEL